MQFKSGLFKTIITFSTLLLLAAPVMAGHGRGHGYGPGDGTGSGSRSGGGSGYGPGDCTSWVPTDATHPLLARGGNGNGGHGPGDGTGNGGDGPADGTGNGPGDCSLA
jgi:hypothetical protein